MYKRYAKYVDRSGDLAGDEALQDSIYVPETLVATAVDDLNNNDDEGPYECSICAGKVMATMADVRKHVAGKFHKRMEERGDEVAAGGDDGNGSAKKERQRPPQQQQKLKKRQKADPVEAVPAAVAGPPKRRARKSKKELLAAVKAASKRQLQQANQ